MTCQEPCGELLEQPPPPPPTPPNQNAAGWVLLGIVIGVLLADWILHKTGHKTVSQWTNKILGKHAWWIKGLILGSLLWHLIFGGPL